MSGTRSTRRLITIDPAEVNSAGEEINNSLLKTLFFDSAYQDTESFDQHETYPIRTATGEEVEIELSVSIVRASRERGVDANTSWLNAIKQETLNESLIQQRAEKFAQRDKSQDRFHLIGKKIGQGQSGTVCHAEATIEFRPNHAQPLFLQDEHDRVIKVERMKNNETFIAFITKVHNEYETAKGSGVHGKRPVIIPIYDPKTGHLISAVSYYVTRHVGQSLDEWITKSKTAPQVSDRITLSIMVLKEFAKRSKKIIHRDIKPANITLSPTGNGVHFIDHGMAGFINQTFPEVAGSPCYLAPELIRNHIYRETPQYSEKTEAFSVACVLFEFFCGIAQDADAKDNIFAYYKLCQDKDKFEASIKKRANTLFSDFPNDISVEHQEKLRAFFLNALSYDASKRFANLQGEYSVEYVIRFFEEISLEMRIKEENNGFIEIISKEAFKQGKSLLLTCPKDTISSAIAGLKSIQTNIYRIVNSSTRFENASTEFKVAVASDIKLYILQQQWQAAGQEPPLTDDENSIDVASPEYINTHKSFVEKFSQDGSVFDIAYSDEFIRSLAIPAIWNANNASQINATLTNIIHQFESAYHRLQELKSALEHIERLATGNTRAVANPEDQAKLTQLLETVNAAINRFDEYEISFDNIVTLTEKYNKEFTRIKPLVTLFVDAITRQHQENIKPFKMGANIGLLVFKALQPVQTQVQPIYDAPTVYHV